MKRALILVLPLLAVGLVACGDDDDAPDVTSGVTTPDVTTADDSSPELTLPDEISIPDLSIPDFSIPDLSLPDNISIPDFSIPDLSDISIPDISEIEDQLRSVLGATGLSDEQIDCVVDAASDLGGEPVDSADLPDLLSQCDIDLSELRPG